MLDLDTTSPTLIAQVPDTLAPFEEGVLRFQSIDKAIFDYTVSVTDSNNQQYSYECVEANNTVSLKITPQEDNIFNINVTIRDDVWNSAEFSRIISTSDSNFFESRINTENNKISIAAPKNIEINKNNIIKLFSEKTIKDYDISIKNSNGEEIQLNTFSKPNSLKIVFIPIQYDTYTMTSRIIDEADMITESQQVMVLENSIQGNFNIYINMDNIIQVNTDNEAIIKSNRDISLKEDAFILKEDSPIKQVIFIYEPQSTKSLVGNVNVSESGAYKLRAVIEDTINTVVELTHPFNAE